MVTRRDWLKVTCGAGAAFTLTGCAANGGGAAGMTDAASATTMAPSGMNLRAIPSSLPSA